MRIVGEDLLRAFSKLFYLQIFVSSDRSKINLQQKFYSQFQRHFYITLVVTLIPENLVTNMLSNLFLSFVEAKGKNQQEYFYFLFRASCALLQRHAKFNKLIGIFSYVILVPCPNTHMEENISRIWKKNILHSL